LIWRAALWTCADSGEPRVVVVVVEEGGEQRLWGAGEEEGVGRVT
jgi:hypothetical protein